jgi:hypothetical protein
MSYDLVLRTQRQTDPTARDFGEDVFLDGLSTDYKVYLFYYPGALIDDAMEDKLKELGRLCAKNLFVNIGRFKDPQFSKIVSQFEIKNFPVIVVTAVSDLASPPDGSLSVYVRLDSKHLLSSPDATYKCLQTVLSLFLQGKVSEAVAHAKWTQRAEAAMAIAPFIVNAMKAVAGFIADHDISVSIAQGKFELKRSGG